MYVCCASCCCLLDILLRFLHKKDYNAKKGKKKSFPGHIFCCDTTLQNIIYIEYAKMINE